MNSVKNRLFGAAIIAGLAVIGSVMNSRQSSIQGAGGPTVTIDQAQLPLPVQGSLEVKGTVATTQSGPWNVGIGGNSASSPLFTRDADNPARRPFQTALCNAENFLGGSAVCHDPGTYTVPSDRRLVIEFVSGSCSTIGSSGAGSLNGLNSLTLQLETTAGGTNVASHIFPPAIFLGQISLAHQTRIYADPGTTVEFFMGAAVGPSPFSIDCTITISGYTITPP
jgi:hypothetical protein